MNMKTSWVDPVQGMSMTVGEEVNMLGEVETVKQVHEFIGRFTSGIVNMEVKITEEKDGRWDGK